MEKKKIAVYAGVLAIILAIIFIPGYLKIRKLARQNSQLETELRQLEQRNKKLAQEQKRLKEDPLYLEAVARKKLGLAKEGEIIYKVVPLQQE